MFIRKEKTREGTTYSLVRSVRTPAGPRDEVVVCLGCSPTVPRALALEIILAEHDYQVLQGWRVTHRDSPSEIRRMERRQARSEASIAELAEALKLTRGTRLEVAALLPAERKRHNEALARDGLEYLPDREGLEYTQRLLDTLPE